MASCKTAQWASNAPYVKLTIIKKASTTTSVTLAYRLEYISESAVQSEDLKTYTISMGGTAVANGAFDIGGRTGTSFVAAASVTVPKTSTTISMTFGVSFNFDLQWASNTYIGVKEASGSILVATSTSYTTCGTPTSLSVVDNKNNTATVSCKVGTNGTNNTSEGVELFATCDGTTPSTSNYKYRCTLYATAGASVSTTLSFADLSQSSATKIFGTSCKGNIKVIARTIGDAGSSYYSALASKNIAFTWYGQAKAPKVITPKINGEITDVLTSYRVTWEAGDGNINNAFSKYSLSVYNTTTKKVVATYSTTNLYYDVPTSAFTADSKYRFDVATVGAITGFNSQVSSSGQLTTKNIGKLSQPNITVSSGSTVPYIKLSDVKTFVDIGSGSVFKLSWNTPTATNNEVDCYKLVMNMFDPETGILTYLHNDNIGNVNEFCVNSSYLSAVNISRCSLRIQLTACSKYGQAYDSSSEIIEVYICKGSGTYIKVEDGPQPIMKRALAFAKLNYVALTDTAGKALTDTWGEPLYAKAARTQKVILDETLDYASLVDADGMLIKDTDDHSILAETVIAQSESGWALMQEFHSKDSNGIWRSSDISYEVLTNADGETITDKNNELIYIL